MSGDMTMDKDNNSILPIDNWFNRILDLRNRWLNNNRSSSLFDTTDLFRDFDDMYREMNSMFNVFNDLSKNAPKELIREYQTPDGNKVHEVGPIVYGY
jgi:HSP20 family protein